MNSPPFSLDFLQPDDSKDDDSPPNLHAEQPFQLDQELLPADPPIIPSTSEENMPVLDTFPATNDFADDFATIKPGANDSCSIVFEFVDENTVSCGICGQSVLYSALFGYHLPRVHPEIKIGNVTVEDIASKEERPVFVSRIPILEDLRIVRKISQFRISTDMNLDLMNKFLQRKLVEKIGRRLPVTLITKERIKCGLCSTPISVNKKFEISNIIRHFSSWHFGHTCAGKWMKKTSYKNGVKALSIEDFVVINIKMSAPENLQCIWCGDAFSSSDLCEHFVEKHADQLAVPRCYLCVQEMIINARMLEKYRQYFEITIQDENQYRCAKLAKTFESELEMDIAIMKRFKEVAGAQKTKDDPASDDTEVPARKRVSNSLQDFGLHYKRKRRFVQPQLRQAAPKNSQFVTVVVHNTHWKCKLCDEDIIGAVISASAIKHYKLQHSAQLEQLQYELVKARLERISSGCMEFIHPQLVDCMVCCKQYKLHKPYNISRCVRHLQSLHAGAMPEYYEQGATNQEEDAEIYDEEAANEQAPENLDETQTIYVNEQNAVYVQLDDDEFFDLNLNAEIPENLFLEAEQKPTPNQSKTKIQDPYSLEDPFGFFDEDTMLHEMEEQALVPKEPHPPLGQNEDQVPNEIV